MKTIIVFAAMVAAYVVGKIHLMHDIKILYPVTWLVLIAEQETHKREREQAAGKTKEGNHE